MCKLCKLVERASAGEIWIWVGEISLQIDDDNPWPKSLFVCKIYGEFLYGHIWICQMLCPQPDLQMLDKYFWKPNLKNFMGQKCQSTPTPPPSLKNWPNYVGSATWIMFRHSDQSWAKNPLDALFLWIYGYYFQLGVFIDQSDFRNIGPGPTRAVKLGLEPAHLINWDGLKRAFFNFVAIRVIVWTN